MKNITKSFATVFAIAIFVILNWATSKDEIYIELDAEASVYQDSLLILNNMDSLAITDAELILMNDQPVGMEGAYTISGYNLSSFSTDTIPLTDFANNDNQIYPDSIPPTQFILSFNVPTQNGFSGFSTDL